MASLASVERVAADVAHAVRAVAAVLIDAQRTTRQTAMPAATSFAKVGRAMADGRSFTLDDVQAIAMDKLVAALDGGKLKGYEITQIVACLNGTQRVRIAEAVEERRKADWEEQKRKAAAAADTIEATLKGSRISKDTVDEIRRTVFGIVD